MERTLTFTHDVEPVFTYDMLKNSTKGEGKHKPSLGEQRISERIKEEKNF
jgi:hypothetical protein